MNGFHRALVRQNKDPEGLGRLQVEYPWFQGNSSEQPSEWVEFCSPYASENSGTWFLPEVGDEVLVYLQDGNLDQPVILGSVHSKKHPPPEAGRAGSRNENGKNDLKFIRTRSGHTLCFDDSDSDRAIVLKDPDGRQFEIASAKDTITIKNAGGDSVTIEKGKITIKSEKVVIEGAQAVELGAGAAEALVKGQAFMSFFNTHTHVTGGPGSPTSPPMSPMTPGLLSQKVKTV